MSLLSKFKSLVQYVSDIHLEMRYSRVIKPQKPFLILAGDIGYPQQESYKEFLHKVSGDFDKVFVLSGNHEYDLVKPEQIPLVDKLIGDICQTRNNLFFLQKKSHCLCPSLNLYITGCTLWSTLPKSKYHIHQDHTNWLTQTLSNSVNRYVIATHHCPLFECLRSKFKFPNRDYFATDQSKLVQSDNVVGWVHGHSHINRDFEIHNKEILSNQYGSKQTPLYRYKYIF